MTETTLSTTFSTPMSNAGDAQQPPALLPLKTFLCNSCQIFFRDGQEQRIHMKEPWHVTNIQRRVASLPAISREAFNAQIEKKNDASRLPPSITSKSSLISDEEVSDDDDKQILSAFQCLFCSQGFARDDVGFATNLEHMRTAHGMNIPDPDLVVDMQSFVGYLATAVQVWHECLYCGATKPSIQSIQSHMRDKGHCLLNFDREPELAEFWESRQWENGEGGATLEEGDPIDLSATEICFTSGKVIGSRHGSPATRKATRERALAMKALTSASGEGEPSLMAIGPQPPSGRQMARHEEMSIMGISVQQRQALVLAEKKAQRNEATARRAREWVYAKAANSQKFDQLDNQMKWGKKNHKLLPR